MIFKLKTHKRLFALIVFLTIFVGRPVFAEIVSNIKIGGLHGISESLVRNVITIKKGDTFSFEALEESISYLRKWGVFDTIEVIPSFNKNSIALAFQLEEAIIIESMDIEGNYPYIENKIRKYLSIHAGDIYIPDRLDEQSERIEAFYKRQGYIGTKVHSSIKSVPDVNGVAITLHIGRGAVLRYGKIEVEGNKTFRTGRFISRINPLRPFSDRKLKDAIRDLRKYYHSHGYPRAKISLAEKLIDLESKRVDIKIKVHEGPHVKIHYEGAYHVRHKTLNKTITILEEGSIDEFEIEMSSREIEKLLGKKGYPNASVEGKKKLLKNGTIIITFKIDEGAPQKIKFLKFRGNEDARMKNATKVMQNRAQAFKVSGAYYPDYRIDDSEVVIAHMERYGYLDASVDEWIVENTKQGYSLDITIPIEAGTQSIIDEIQFNGSNSFTKKEMLKSLKSAKGKRFNKPSLDDELKRLQGFFADNGFPYATINQNWEIDPASKKIRIIYEIQENTKVHIGRILIVGDVLTSQKAIKRAMSLKEGAIFSYKKLMESQLQIRRLGPFTSVNVSTIGIENKKPIVHIKVKVEEQRPFLVDLGVSYSTDEKLTGSLTFANINAFGWAKTNILKLTGGIKLTKAELVWQDPRFLGSSFEMTTNSWIQHKKEPAYSFIQAGGAVGWFRGLRRVGFLFRWEVNRSHFLSGDSVAADADSLRNNTISKISLSSSFDSRNNFADPRDGFFTLGSVDIYNELSGPGANFFKFRWEGENDVSPFRWLTFSTALRFGRIQAVGKNVSIPTNELFFLGGDDTIRGFSEDSLGPINAQNKATGGRTRWILNEEMRIRLFMKLQLIGFFDMGSLTNTFSDIDWNDIRKSAGIGLRFITPVGPIRLDYGFKLDRRTGESKGRLHFTFGYVF